MVTARRKARRLALQALYEADLVGHNAEAVLARLIDQEKLSEDNASFASELVRGVTEHRKELDRNIHKHAKAFPVAQIPVIDRNVLRLAIYEIIIDNRIPVKIGINEAVELAKSFGTDSSPKFVNGVLGSIVLKLDKNESVESKGG